MTPFTWYFCGGCGASMQCRLCGATECSQSCDPNACIGCAALKAERAAVAAGKHREPWHLRTVRGARPCKPMRKHVTRLRQHRAKLRRDGVWGRGGRRWERIRGRWTRQPTWDEMLAL